MKMNARSQEFLEIISNLACTLSKEDKMYICRLRLVESRFFAREAARPRRILNFTNTALITS